jgi:hypothetical protein
LHPYLLFLQRKFVEVFIFKYYLSTRALPCIITDTFWLIVDTNGTCGLLLFAAHVKDVILLNLSSLNWKSTFNIFWHREKLHDFWMKEFELEDNGIKELVSYKVKLTSGLEKLDEQYIWYVCWAEFLIKVIVLLELNNVLLKIMLITG